MNSRHLHFSRRQFSLASIACFSTAGCGVWNRAAATEQVPDVRFVDLGAEIEQAVQGGKAPSIAVGVAQAGEVVWMQGFGWADRARRVPATARTRYAVASVAKPITATGLMQLAERGAIDLAAPANTYLEADARLGSRGGDAEAATVRHLLQHRAGLPAHGRYFYSGDGLTPPLIQETIRNYGIVVHPPGQRHVYSNLGYGVLAHITARAAGADYASHMCASLFEPLGMFDTSIEIAPTLSAPAATLYDEGGGIVPHYVFDEWGSGRVWSSVHDLLRFGHFHLKERLPNPARILSEHSIDRMLAERQSTGAAGAVFGPEWFYGLGWNGRLATLHNPFWFGHNGRMAGVSSELRLFPDARVAIVVLSNGRQSLTYDLIDRIADILMPQHAAMRAGDPMNGPRPPRPPFASGALLGQWAGAVTTPQGSTPVRFTFAPDNSADLAVGDQPPARLTGLRFQDSRLVADCEATLPTADTRSYPHSLQLDLTLRDDELGGTLTARGPADRVRFHLPFWVSARRAE